MLRQDAGRFMLRKYLSDKKKLWKRMGRLGMAVAGLTPKASFLTKIGKMLSAGCQLCKIARHLNKSMHTAQKPKSTQVCHAYQKIVTLARCGNEGSFSKSAARKIWRKGNNKK